MLVSSLQKEWKLFKRDGRLLWIFIALVIMMILGIFSSGYKYHADHKLQIEAETAERSRWIDQGEKNPHSAAHYGIYLFKPNTPLNVIDPGVSDYQGDILFLEAHKRGNASFQPIQDAVESQRFGTISPATLLQLLLPLFIILTGFTFFAGEREQGTLRMLLLSGLTPRRLFLHKFAVLFCFSILFLIPVAIYISALTTGTVTPDMQRLTGILLAYALYIVFWVSLTLTISSYSATARIALTILLILWASTSLIIPKIAIDLATLRTPTISTQELYSRMESDLYTPERIVAIDKFKQETLNTYGVKTVEELPFNWAGEELLFGENYSDKVFDKLFNVQITAFRDQTSSYQFAGLFSPFISIQMLSSGLATSDWYHNHLFVSAAEEYRRNLLLVLNSHVRDHKDTSYKGDKILWGSIPEFSYSVPAFAKVISFYLPTLLAMAAWIMLVIAASELAIQRLSREGKQ